MDIPNNRDRWLNMHHIAFSHQNLFGFLAYLANERFMKDLFSEELSYALIEVETHKCKKGYMGAS